jgi:hypothetical protein
LPLGAVTVSVTCVLLFKVTAVMANPLAVVTAAVMPVRKPVPVTTTALPLVPLGTTTGEAVEGLLTVGAEPAVVACVVSATLDQAPRKDRTE